MIKSTTILVITSLAPKALRAIFKSTDFYCTYKHLKLLPSSPSSSYLKFKLSTLTGFKQARVEGAPKNTEIINYFPVQCLLRSLHFYLFNRKRLPISLEANQAILDSLTRSKLSFKLFILNKSLALRIYSEYYKIRLAYSLALLQHFNIDSLFVYHRTYIIWYAFIDAAKHLDIPIVVAQPTRTAFQVTKFPIASNNPISLCFANIEHDKNFNTCDLDEKLPWVHKSIVDALEIEQQHMSEILTSSKRKLVLLSHLVSDTKYLLTNTKLYDTYFEWFIDTVSSYINNNVTYPLIIRFHPKSFHPHHQWSFHLLLNEVNKLNNFADFLHEEKISLDLPWSDSKRKIFYDNNDVFLTYQGSVILDLAIVGIRPISMNAVHMNQEITYIPNSINYYTSTVISDRFISAYSSELPRELRDQAKRLYSEYVKFSIKP
jgi:hypothetical protein